MHSTGQRFRHYFELTRLHKFPLGCNVICWPGILGLVTAAHNAAISRADLITKISIFIVSGSLLHSAFCIYNDICDRDLDGQVERTKNRPLVTGAISVQGAWTEFIAFLLVTAYMISLANIGRTAIVFATLSLPLHFLYPLAKRWTWWPQAWLGISNGWSFLIGWFTVMGKNGNTTQTKASIIMYLAMVSWTMYFDTIYATQDRVDDARVGIKSTARLFGKHIRKATSAFATLTTLCLIATGLLSNFGTLYYLISCGGAMMHFTWQMVSWDVDNDKQSMALFKSNGDYWGTIVFVGLMSDMVFKTAFI